MPRSRRMPAWIVTGVIISAQTAKNQKYGFIVPSHSVFWLAAGYLMLFSSYFHRRQSMLHFLHDCSRRISDKVFWGAPYALVQGSFDISALRRDFVRRNPDTSTLFPAQKQAVQMNCPFCEKQPQSIRSPPARTPRQIPCPALFFRLCAVPVRHIRSELPAKTAFPSTSESPFSVYHLFPFL